MSSIILERNGVIEVILCSSHQAGTLSRPSNKYPRSFCPAMVASLRRSRSVQPPLQYSARLTLPGSHVSNVWFNVAVLRELGGFPLDVKWHGDLLAAYARAFERGAVYTPGALASC